MNIKIIRLEKKVFKLWCEKKEQYGFGSKTHNEFAVFLLETIVELSNDGAKFVHVPIATDINFGIKGKISNPNTKTNNENRSTENVGESPAEEDDRLTNDNRVNAYQMTIKDESIDECETVIVMPSDEINMDDLNTDEYTQQSLTPIKKSSRFSTLQTEHQSIDLPHNFLSNSKNITPTLVPCFDRNFVATSEMSNKTTPMFDSFQPNNRPVTYISIPLQDPNSMVPVSPSHETFSEVTPIYVQPPLTCTNTQRLMPNQDEIPSNMAAPNSSPDNLDLMRKEFVAPSSYSYGPPEETQEDRSAISSIFQRLMNRGFLRHKSELDPNLTQPLPTFDIQSESVEISKPILNKEEAWNKNKDVEIDDESSRKFKIEGASVDGSEIGLQDEEGSQSASEDGSKLDPEEGSELGSEEESELVPKEGSEPGSEEESELGSEEGSEIESEEGSELGSEVGSESAPITDNEYENEEEISGSETNSDDDNGEQEIGENKSLSDTKKKFDTSYKQLQNSRDTVYQKNPDVQPLQTMLPPMISSTYDHQDIPTMVPTLLNEQCNPILTPLIMTPPLEYQQRVTQQQPQGILDKFYVDQKKPPKKWTCKRNMKKESQNQRQGYSEAINGIFQRLKDNQILRKPTAPPQVEIERIESEQELEQPSKHLSRSERYKTREERKRNIDDNEKPSLKDDEECMNDSEKPLKKQPRTNKKD
ncbi:serine-aspartate repeat-containing protein D-like [Clytia hemisphaerica]|uniref:Uncharacterized protein n=1 Tax=Clytia hemisphaerica TaxID=252671 RepID=A0A7M5XBJ3_9CNID